MKQYNVTGMSCAACSTRVEKAVSKVPGVTECSVSLLTNSMGVEGTASPEAIIAAVEQAGYGASEKGAGKTAPSPSEAEKQLEDHETPLLKKRLIWSVGFLLVLMYFSMGHMMWGWPLPRWFYNDKYVAMGLTQMLLTIIIMVINQKFFISGFKSLWHRSPNMDTLVALGTGVAWLYSMSVNLWPQWFPMEARHLYYEASAMIIGLINLGHMLEARARQRSSKALERLLDLTPPTARVVTDEGEKSVPLAEVQPGMTLRLTTGDRVPVDGKITQGEAWLDEAMLTGEPIPQQKSDGDAVHAGTVVQDGSVLFTASAVGSHTTLSRIIRMVRQAQSSKPEIGQLADKISAIFVPVVVGIALLSAAIWYFFGPAPQIVYTLVIATTVLIIACPCALGLATPMSIISGVGRAAEFGVLVRDADALQRASTLDTLVFDKTGTLTEGKPQVVAVTTAGIAEEVNTWAGWKQKGFDVLHGTKALFNCSLIWGSKGDGATYKASFFGASQVHTVTE